MKDLADKKSGNGLVPGQFRVSFGRLLAVGALLTAFGVEFNRFTEWFNRQREDRSSYLVVIGVAVTVVVRQLLPYGLIYDVYSFACSGFPMIAGQLARHNRRKRRAMQRRGALNA